jgi:SAM-dependent methyltransferase
MNRKDGGVAMAEVDWDSRARVGVGLQSVIDPADRTGLKNSLIDRIQWDRIVDWAGRRRSVLDFGCGVGRFAQRFARLGVDYCGVDASGAMIESAKRLHPDGPARFLRSAGLPIPFDAGSFDGCLSVGVLQCLKTADGRALRDTVAELARVLAPGGELLMIEQASASGQNSGSVSESSSEQDYLDALSPWFEVADTKRVRCGTLSRLSSLYIRAGSMLPMRDRVEGFLAKRESSIARRASAQFLQGLVYYDIAICAVKRPGR